ncbi:hypothetical protein [Cellulomonas sp.]|uniref:hypothetical protein n=1 Tax=Cellulomonas sp. TaxID=40001 RepID=UPI0025C51DA8|nr:hypothetical protein [Cellulomonas sp.]
MKTIARRLGPALTPGLNTVRAALASGRAAEVWAGRGRAGPRVDEFEPEIRRLLLTELPDVPATVIAERIGWVHSSSVLLARVAQLRPLFRPAGPADHSSATT